MIFIYNRDEIQVDVLDIEPRLTEEISKLNTLEFETYAKLEKGYRVVYKQDGKPYEFIIIDSDYVRNDDVLFTYFCQDSLTELNAFPILDKRPQGSYKQALTSAFENTRWQLVFSADFSEAYTQNNSFYHISVLEAFSKVAEDYNIEWHTEYTSSGSKITSRKLVISKLGTQSNSRLEFGKNIKQFSRKISSEPIFTALYGYGKGEETESGGFGRRISFADINGGLAYVTNEEARLKYGIGSTGTKEHLFGFFIDEEETDKTKLLESTKKELERVSQPQAEYTVDAVNLHLDCGIGDTVPVIDDELGFRGNTRIIKVVTQGDNKEFTFGQVQKAFTDSFQKEIQKSAEATEIKITSIMEARLNQIADVYFGEDGYNYDLKVGNEYGLPAGLYSFDAPIDENPAKVIYFGAGKLLIADSKATDGGWAWKTAIDGQGIVGSSIVTNSITVNQVSSDFAQNLDISSNKSIKLLSGKVDTKGKYRNLIPHADYFTQTSGFTQSKTSYVQAEAGHLYFSSAGVVGNTMMYIPIEAKSSTTVFTLWIGEWYHQEQDTRTVGLGLVDENFNLLTGSLNAGANKVIKLSKIAEGIPKYLRVSLNSFDIITTASGVRFYAEYIALVEGDVPNINWEMTYQSNGGTLLELTQNSILASVGSAYLKIEEKTNILNTANSNISSAESRLNKTISEITLSGDRITLDGNTRVTGDLNMQGQAIEFTNAGNVSTVIDRENIKFYDQVNNSLNVGELGAIRYRIDGNPTTTSVLRLGHKENAFIAVSRWAEDSTGKFTWLPYVSFDRYQVDPLTNMHSHYIKVSSSTVFLDYVTFKQPVYLNQSATALGLKPESDRVVLGNILNRSGLIVTNEGDVIVVDKATTLRNLKTEVIEMKNIILSFVDGKATITFDKVHLVAPVVFVQSKSVANAIVAVSAITTTSCTVVARDLSSTGNPYTNINVACFYMAYSSTT